MGRMLLTNQWNDLLDSCLLPSLNVSSRGGGGRGGGGGGGGSAKNSTPAEQYAACRVVEASSVILIGRCWDRIDDDDNGMVVVDALHGPLVKIVNATGRATQVRVASLRCLAMIHFLSSGGGGGRNTTNNDYHCFEEEEDNDHDGDDATMESVLKLCEQLSSGKKYRGEEVPWSLRAGALDCWSLLGSVLHDVRVAGGNGNRISNGNSHNDGYRNSDGDGDGDYDNHNDESDGNDDISNNSNNNSNDDAYHSTIPPGRGLGLLPILSSCLDSTDVGLRSSAGECLALIHECRLNLGMEGDAADNATERRFSRGEMMMMSLVFLHYHLVCVVFFYLCMMTNVLFLVFQYHGKKNALSLFILTRT